MPAFRNPEQHNRAVHPHGRVPILPLLFAIVATAGVASAQGQQLGADKAALRNDAFLLMGAGLSVPGMAAYCNRFVEDSPGLIAAAAKWNERHHFILERTVRALEWAGGLTNAEKRELDQLAFKLAKQIIDSVDDKKRACKSIEIETRTGTLDLDRREDTAPAVRRLLDASFQ